MRRNAPYRCIGFPPDDPVERLRRQERQASLLIIDGYRELADLASDSAEADALRSRLAKAKTAWWETVKQLDGAIR